MDDKIKIYFKIAIILLAILAIDQLTGLMMDSSHIFIPLIVAVFINLLLSPVIDRFKKWRIPHTIALILTLIFSGLFLYLFIIIINYSISNFISGIPAYEKEIRNLLQQVSEFTGLNDSKNIFSGENVTLSHLIKEFSIGKYIAYLLNFVTNIITQTSLAFLFLMFFIFSRDKRALKINKAFKKATSAKIERIIDSIQSQAQRYIVTKSLISLLTSGLVMLVLWLFGVDFVITWGILAFFFNFIPNIGSILASVFPLLMAAIQYENDIHLIWLAICLIGVQFICGNILEPKVMGESINLSPAVILLSLLFWGTLWGIVGMFLAVPLTATIKIIFDNIESMRPLGILIAEK